MPRKIAAAGVLKVNPAAGVRVGSDNRSHVFDAFGEPWCEDDVEALDPASDVDCPKCVEAIEEECE